MESRFDDLEAFFKATKSLGAAHAASTKGVMFVLTYAVYEFTVKSVVKEAIESMKIRQHRLADLSPSMLALFLSPELDALRDSGKRTEWQKRLTIFERAFSKDPIDLSSDTGLPNDGSHYRYAQLAMIFKVFGIQRLAVRRKKHIQRISEVVGHRNAVAHGGETPSDIGRRYTRAEIANVMRQMKSVCLLQISVFEGFCNDTARHLRK